MLFAALAGFVFGFIGSVPVAGPIAVLVLERSLAHRYSDAEGIAVGGAVAESAYAGAAFLGLGFLIKSYPIVLVGARARLTGLAVGDAHDRRGVARVERGPHARGQRIELRAEGRLRLVAPHDRVRRGQHVAGVGRDRHGAAAGC